MQVDLYTRKCTRSLYCPQCTGDPEKNLSGSTKARLLKNCHPASHELEQLTRGPPNGLLVEVKNWLLSKCDPQKEKVLKDRIILCTLMNKLQPGSVPKINRSMQNWHQLEDLSTFIKAMVNYSMNSMDLWCLFLP
ncbi:hypothetical protein GH733_006117 [Mirounga leonina]|nr:hypothetical protein GH733_006117 [Mirounga leonina]